MGSPRLVPDSDSDPIRRPRRSPLTSRFSPPDCPLSERVMGIEPTLPAWKAGTLPLSYTRGLSRSVLRVSRARSELGGPAGAWLLIAPMTPGPSPDPFHVHRERHGWSRIRTCEGNATRFTVWPLWPLGYPPEFSIASCRSWCTPHLGWSPGGPRPPPEWARVAAELAVRVELTTLGLQNRSSAG
jgi:hypothetical protein